MSGDKGMILMGDGSRHHMQRILTPDVVARMNSRVEELVFGTDNIIGSSGDSGLIIRHPVHNRYEEEPATKSWSNILLKALTQEDEETVKGVLYWFAIDELTREVIR